jgi:hypothetical protein
MRFSLIVSLFTAPLSIFASSSIITKHEFMSIMRESKIQTSSPERKLRLQKSILAAAIPSKTKTNNNNNVNNINIDIDRSLYYDDQANATDDSYANYGFNISAYSLKYAGCSSISTFSDDMAEDEDSTTVVETDQYAVFRFCPSDSCSDTTTYGCMDDYGEYMVPLYTWMTIVAEYREEEFERYCGYCDACYAANYYNSTDDGNNNNNNRNLADDNDDGAAQADDYVANCGYENACKGYYDLCNNDDDKVDYSQFFGCKAYGASDDLTLYIGPHCAKDKSSIVIAPFQDDACSIYEGDTYDLATVTGLPFTSDALMEYYETDCIPCKESVSTIQIQYPLLSGQGEDFLKSCKNSHATLSFIFHLDPDRACHSKTMPMTMMTLTPSRKYAKHYTDTLPNATDTLEVHPPPPTNPPNKKITNMQYVPSLHPSLLEHMTNTDTFTLIS